MKVNHTHYCCVVAFICCFFTQIASGQESVFTGLRNDLKRADEYYLSKSYNQAIELYLVVQQTKKAPGDIALRIARTYYGLRDNKNSAAWYGEYLKRNESLPVNDELIYAESLSGMGAYKEAIQWFEKYQARNPDDQTILQKIWRIKNIEYLYEDSTYFTVKPVSFNTSYAEFGPTYYKDGIVFVSNQTLHGRVQKVDGITNAPFNRLFYTGWSIDSLTNTLVFSKPIEFGRSLNGKFHKGTVAFFPGQEKMIYTKSVAGIGTGASTLQLFLAQNISGVWNDIAPFPYNDTHYSVSHPTLTADGKTLYFVSDMPGGFGASDLYKSVLQQNDTWTKPENLGASINSPHEETFPFCHSDATLYFASNGHGGFGGLDIFKVNLNNKERSAIQNLGYPVNTGFDDFGIVLDADASHGFISSNRNKGQLDDDIFELEIDLQTYPLIISGILRYSPIIAQDSVDLKPLPNAAISLIDNNTNLEVGKTVSDASGHFTLEIPYSSQYKLAVVEKRIGNKLASLEIPKNKKLHTDYEIVVVQDRLNSVPERTSPPVKKN